MKRHRGYRHSHKLADMDFYACHSGLRDWNGCYKVGSALWILLLCLVLDNLWVSIFVIVTMGALNRKGNRIEIRAYLRLLRIPIFFLATGCAVLAFEISKEPAGEWSVALYQCYLYADAERLWQAAKLFFRAMGAVSAMYFMALSTPAWELASVLQKIHVPKVFTELMHMIYRFIFILAKVRKTMKMAACSRMGDMDFKTSCRTFGQIGGNLLIVSLKKANTYYDAMESRGYEGEMPFWEQEKPVRMWQILALAAYTMALAALWFWRKP